MPDYSTQSARPGVNREALEFDVLFVGAGPANLTALWRLLDLIEAHNRMEDVKRLEGLTIGMIEKSDAIGDHAFSGAVLDPRALAELCPDYMDRGFPSDGEVSREELWYFTSDRSGFKFPILPPFLKSHGCHVVSLSRLTRWMAEQIGAREIPGVEVVLLPGFTGMNVIWDNNGRVAGVQTADKGVNSNGSPRNNFEPGNRIMTKVAVFADGPMGHLSQEIISLLGLQKGSVNPQVFETGVKEIWEIPTGRLKPGFVLHSAGWPSPGGENGGSFVYAMGQDRVAIGYVASLDTADPFVDAHCLLQKFKTHPRIAEIIEGGKLLQYGGKAMAIGGWYSMPRLAFDGGILVGDCAQMINSARLKGIHLGMKGGMCAAEAILEALARGDFSRTSLQKYEHEFLSSWAADEIRQYRNFHAIVSKGLTPVSGLRLGFAMLNDGWLPSDPMRRNPDYKRTKTVERFYGRKSLKATDIDRGFKFDGERLIQKLDDLYTSGVIHDEHQPCHLKIIRGDEVCAECWEKYGSPCTVFCPAQVYEMRVDSSQESRSAAGEAGDAASAEQSSSRTPRLEIAYSNCLHCKTCTIKCPEQNVIWTPPEGGGGPKFTIQ
ncbi:MAG: electron transfer flavoprotein-ubiquinone oxidoreductase [Holophagales bacterium]|jgi:electron-transferring-flavoprotein dehydrogenase|nr:electron transfer flavoprotein-ubiquinone oxidoreductase [Holophagales bacterium]